MKNFPNMVLRSLDDVLILCRYILKERSNDINDFKNLNNVFMSGRKVGKIPTSGNDVDPSDRVGDFNYDASYLYLVVLDGIDAKWRRMELSTW